MGHLLTEPFCNETGGFEIIPLLKLASRKILEMQSDRTGFEMGQAERTYRIEQKKRFQQ